MTTENVALLFTDVVGSTELSQRLPPELPTRSAGSISRSCARPWPRPAAPR